MSAGFAGRRSTLILDSVWVRFLVACVVLFPRRVRRRVELDSGSLPARAVSRMSLCIFARAKSAKRSAKDVPANVLASSMSPALRNSDTALTERFHESVCARSVSSRTHEPPRLPRSYRTSRPRLPSIGSGAISATHEHLGTAVNFQKTRLASRLAQHHLGGREPDYSCVSGEVVFAGHYLLDLLTQSHSQLGAIVIVNRGNF